MTAAVVIPVHLQRGALGLPSRAGDVMRGKTVLRRVVERMRRVDGAERVVLVHPQGQDVRPLLQGDEERVAVVAAPAGLWDEPTQAMWRAARRWLPAAWRGGFGGACVFDELLPAGPLVHAMKHVGATSALLVGPDWPLVDPATCAQVLALHLPAPQAMKVTFSQAPPGHAGVATSLEVLEDFHEHRGSFAQVLRYNPRMPSADPIGREVCVQVPAAVRGCARRFVYDTDRGVALIDAIAAELGDGIEHADAGASVATTAARAQDDVPPALVTLELTPRRAVSGPVTPQHYTMFDRPDLQLDAARRVIDEVAALSRQTCLLLGGLGDPLLHPHWAEVVEHAAAAGLWGVGVATDLVTDDAALDRLLQLPLDVVLIHFNADRPPTYQEAMGSDGFDALVKRYERLFNERNRRKDEATVLPWLIPTMVKTRQTLGDLEEFFNRWMHYAGHAVVEPWTRGPASLQLPDLSPLPMAPPRRRACRQLGARLTVLSDGRAAQCDQDWLGDGACAGGVAEAWGELQRRRALHEAGRWAQCPLCEACAEWHRP